jgi:glycosyltransferase involved in cell wall biosynthesis
MSTVELQEARQEKPRTGAKASCAPRVLYLTDLLPSGKFGSMEEQILTLARAFHEQGGLFLPVFGGSLEPPVVERYAAMGLPVNGLNLHQLSVRNLSALLRLVRENGVSIIHWNFYSPINPYVWLLSILAPRLKHCLTDHTSRELPLPEPPRGLKKIVKRLLFSRYQKVWCISNFVVECLKHSGTWSNINRCTYFINTDRFKPDPAVRAQTRIRLGATEKFVVLFVAHVIRVKGGDVAIRALAELPESAHLWVVGDGEDLPKLRSLSEELSVSNRIQFLGHQSHVEPFMQAADCFVCPSLWGEATGLVNLEALASGLPVVASAIGGIPEFVDDGKTGLLSAPGDYQQLAEHIRRLAADTDFYQRLSKAARDSAVDRFSIERRLPEYVRAYQW